MNMGQKALGLVRITISFTMLLSIVACSKHEDDNKPTAAINPPIYKTVTRENYLSGKKFCQTYSNITSKEFGRYIRVPMNYNNPEAGTIEVYAYSMSPFDSNKPTYIYVDGGPGQNTHGAMPNFFDGQYNELRFDQRGLGCSSPETFDIYKDASLYSTENTIRDMDLIRQAYGIDKWSVYGVSYGTVASTMYASKFSNSTRSLVLEGVVGRVDLLHDADYKASKLNLAIANLNSKQREALYSIVHGKSQQEKAFVQFIYSLFYSDKGMRQVANYYLPRIISTDGAINQDGLNRIKKYFDQRDSQYPFAQQPGAVDTNILGIIYCKNLNARHSNNKNLAYSTEKGFYTNVDYSTNNQLGCDKLGVKETDEKPYELSQNPVQAPVYYFQGSHDGATIAAGAIMHWQTVPQNKSFFMLAQKGGHNPNLTRIKSENVLITKAETQLFKNAISSLDITKTDLFAINSVIEADQKWILYSEDQKFDTDIEQELQGISNRSFLVNSMPSL